MNIDELKEKCKPRLIDAISSKRINNIIGEAIDQAVQIAKDEIVEKLGEEREKLLDCYCIAQHDHDRFNKGTPKPLCGSCIQKKLLDETITIIKNME